jgi:hypothetical protein
MNPRTGAKKPKNISSAIRINGINPRTGGKNPRTSKIILRIDSINPQSDKKNPRTGGKILRLDGNNINKNIAAKNKINNKTKGLKVATL